MEYTIKEAADFLGVDPSILRSWDNEGKLIAERTEGNHRRYRQYDKKELIKYKAGEVKENKNIIIGSL